MNRHPIKYVLLGIVALSLPIAAHAASRPDSWITMKTTMIHEAHPPRRFPPVEAVAREVA